MATGVPGPLDLFDIPGGLLVVFVSVVFVKSPTVFRITRGLTMDIRCAITAPPPSPAEKAPSISCFGRACQTPAAP